VLERLRKIIHKPTLPGQTGTALDEVYALIREYRRRGVEAVRKDEAFRQKLGCLMKKLAPLIELHDYLEFMDKASQLVEDYQRRGAEYTSQDQKFRQKLRELIDLSNNGHSALIKKSPLLEKLKKISGIIDLMNKALQLFEKYQKEGEEAIKEDQSLLQELYNITEYAKADSFTYKEYRATQISVIIEGIQEKLSPVRQAYCLVRASKLREEGKVSDQGIYSFESIQKGIKDLINEPILEGTQVREELEHILRELTKEKPQP